MPPPHTHTHTGPTTWEQFLLISAIPMPMKLKCYYTKLAFLFQCEMRLGKKSEHYSTPVQCTMSTRISSSPFCHRIPLTLLPSPFCNTFSVSNLATQSTTLISFDSSNCPCDPHASPLISCNPCDPHVMLCNPMPIYEIVRQSLYNYMLSPCNLR